MRRETDCLILGSGIAGLSAAVSLARAGLKSTVVTAAQSLSETNTVYAQGGIIFQGAAEGDRDRLVADILEAGCYINYRPAVEQLADLGPKLVRRVLIDTVGVGFDKDPSGEFHLTREAAHSDSRILHRGDETGRAIEEAMLSYCQRLGSLDFVPGTTAVNLLMTSFHGRDRSRLHSPARCFGAFVFDQASGEVYPIFARHTIIATGGIGQVYLHNTNGRFSRGDGIALAHRAGCRLENLEYVQFHPTTFYQPPSPRFLVSEALRGEGAVLLNQEGKPFLSRYLPGYATPELAPRDRVSQAIHQELLSSGAPCVYLDISHKPAEWVRSRFPFVHRTCLKYGVDITTQPIPVVPGAHYHCGGVWTGLEGETSVANLWAAGEVSCTGVHGANRLASTSLLESLVWGTRSGEAIARRLSEGERPEFPEIEPWRAETAQVDPSFLKQDWLTLKHTMWNYVGLIKTEARLKRAEGILAELGRGIEMFYRKASLSDELIGLRHASLTALLVLEACKRNPRSLGCYLREELEI